MTHVKGLKKILVCLLIGVTFVCHAASADYEAVFQYYMEEGLDAFYEERFEEAIFYFKTAQAIDPDRPQPQQYLNLIKREQEGRINDPNRPQTAQRPQETRTETAELHPHDRAAIRVTEQAIYGILQKRPIDGSLERIDEAVSDSIRLIKDDLDEELSENDWSSIKKQSITAVAARVARLQYREDIRRTDASALAQRTETTTVTGSPVSDAIKTEIPEGSVLIAPLAPQAAPGSAIKRPAEQPEPYQPPKFQPSAPLSTQTEYPVTITDPAGSVRRFYDREDLRLDSDLWAQHSTLKIEIEIGKSIIFIGQNIKRHLTTLEDLLEVTRVDKDRLRVSALKRGNLILYIWDDTGRWVFNIRCVYPFETAREQQRLLNQEQVSPFRLIYSNNWSTQHQGPQLDDMQKQYLIFTNWLGVEGPTPYGNFDASINTYRYPASTEIVGQRVGLVDGKIGPFKEFTIRGYDTFRSLSELTLPGRYFRGVALDSYAFQHKIAYSYFRGQDQSITIFATDGSITRRKSYLEGYRLVYNPDLDHHQYALNYARGYGEARSPTLKDEVYSIQGLHKVFEYQLESEIAHDSDEFAAVARAEKKTRELEINLGARDVHPDFQTIYGIPFYSGQVGASVNVAYKPEGYRVDTFLDVYRDRVQPNLDNPDMVNLDFSTSYSKQINDLSSWSASLGAVYSPQVLFPRKFFSVGTNYSRSIPVGEAKFLSLSLAQTFQWSRYDDSPSSEYDRYGLRAGMRYRLFRDLFYSLSYEYTLVRDVLNSDWSDPGALLTSINYSMPIGSQVSAVFGLTYRNEMNTGGNFSFLAGQDSIGKSISLTYRPTDTTSVYMDSQLRRVWPHNSNATNSDYYDWNVLVGMKSEWDLPFRWNPTGDIQGVVYKDYNGNSFQDPGEPGLAGIRVIVGKYQTMTNENGEYSIKISAKKANVSLDLKTIPSGFVFSTALSRSVNISHRQAARVDFGLTSRSGIYGVAFIDRNENGRPDRGEEFLSNIVVRLDSGEITKTDFSGSYFFENLKPGKYKVRIDVNSIPIQYSPRIRVETEVLLEEGMTHVHNIPVKENPSPAP